MRRHVIGLGLLIALQGCAYQQAMKRGHEAAAAHDWDRAHRAYQYAEDLKPGRAGAELAQARTEAAGAALAAFEAAVGAKDLATAADHLRTAEGLDPAHPRLEEVRSAALEAILADVWQRMDSADDDLRGTYTYAVSAKRLFPAAPQLEDASATLRERVATESAALTKAGEYAEAREMARTIAEMEPEQATRGVTVDRQVTEAWVADLVRDAKAAERSRPGLAAVYYARAFEVGGDVTLAAASSAALEAAGPDGKLAVYVDSQGEGGRHWRLRKAVRSTVDGAAGVAPGRESAYDLRVLVAANGERCAEAKEAKPIEKEFVAGTRQVTNPAYTEVTDALKVAEAEAATANAALAKAKKALEVVQGEFTVLAKVRDAKKGEVDTWVAAREETERQLNLVREREAEVAKQLETPDAATNEASAEDLKIKLEVVQKLVAEWQAKIGTDEEGIEAAKAALREENTKLDPVQVRVDDQSTAVAHIESALAAAQTKVADLKKKQAETPAKVPEEIKQVAKVSETTWTLTCQGPATVFYAPRWKTELPKKQPITATASTTDVSRPGHEGAKIEADPKAYPRAQKDLVADLDKAAHEAIAPAVQALVADGFQRRIADAFASEDVGRGTHELVATYVGAPERIDDATRAKLIEHLKANFGIEDPGVLGLQPQSATPSSEPAEEAPAPAEEAPAPVEEAPVVAEPGDAAIATGEAPPEQAAANAR